MFTGSAYVSLVIPIHNESPHVWTNVTLIRERIRYLNEPYEILLVENGSNDDTKLIAKALTQEFNEIKLLTLPEASLGDALKLGFNSAQGEHIIYYPLDLSVELSFIEDSLKLLEKYDVVTASKRSKYGDMRPISRRVVSIAYHYFVKRLYGSKLNDTTCAKAYRKVCIAKLIDDIPGNNKIFETELIMKAERLGMNIFELPVRVVEKRPSRERLIKKIMGKLEDLLSTKLDQISVITGTSIIFIGLIGLSVTNLLKAMRNLEINFPEITIISAIMVLVGFQIAAVGLLTRLVLQVRSEVSKISTISSTKNEESLKTSIVVKEELHD